MRARLVLAAAILLAVAGIAVAVTRDGGAREVTLRTAPETNIASPPASAPEVPTTVPQTVPTTTTIALPTTVSLPPLTVPLPKLPVTVTTPTVPATTSPPPAPRSRPAECGDPHGYGGWGGSRTQTTGKVTVTVLVYQCESYAGETVQNWVEVDHPNGLLRSARVDYGDGTVVDTGVSPSSCQDQRPRPYFVNLSPHPYAAPGQYTVTATVVVADCDDPTMQDQTATGSTTAFVYAGKRP